MLVWQTENTMCVVCSVFMFTAQEQKLILAVLHFQQTSFSSFCVFFISRYKQPDIFDKHRISTCTFFRRLHNKSFAQIFSLLVVYRCVYEMVRTLLVCAN